MSVARYSGRYWDVAWWTMIGALAAWLALQLLATPFYGVRRVRQAFSTSSSSPLLGCRLS